MSEWLGVDDDFDAKRRAAKLALRDNFDGDDNGWKGGATGVDGVTELELRDAITSMGDDELLGHDISFVPPAPPSAATPVSRRSLRLIAISCAVFF